MTAGMSVSSAVAARVSVRAFRPDPVPADLVLDILCTAARAPSGGNVQPWQAYALTGEPLEQLRSVMAAKLARGETEEPEYAVYPPDLWEPHRSYRFQCGEDLYATLGVPREDRERRLAQFARNGQFFGAPVGLFFTLDRRMGAPQWADFGMFLQTIMLLAVERGLDTCAQEWWARYPRTVTDFLELPPDQMLYCGMALGYRDPDAAINSLRTRRAPVTDFLTLRGFDAAPAKS
jgi:nitroreductase